ncbi:hypothetical protein AB0A71_42135 [Kitasatospora aureofaciens]|uniref:hypothetical protein n=1 Tax=Kitasatospora aureofaciens TaxID=1894 RepID=UPI0033FD9B13
MGHTRKNLISHTSGPYRGCWSGRRTGTELTAMQRERRADVNPLAARAAQEARVQALVSAPAAAPPAAATPAPAAAPASAEVPRAAASEGQQATPGT